MQYISCKRNILPFILIPSLALLKFFSFLFFLSKLGRYVEEYFLAYRKETPEFNVNASHTFTGQLGLFHPSPLRLFFFFLPFSFWLSAFLHAVGIHEGKHAIACMPCILGTGVWAKKNWKLTLCICVNMSGRKANKNNWIEQIARFVYIPVTVRTTTCDKWSQWKLMFLIYSFVC